MKAVTEMHVAVLMGGPGAEREVSLASGRGVTEALRTVCRMVTPVDVRGPGFPLPGDVDIAFNVVHGTYGEDGGIQAELEGRGVAYTGEGVEGSRVAFDKILTKERFRAAGVSTAAHHVRRAMEPPGIDPPCVLKAPRQGSSVGVHIIRDAAAVAAALEDLARLDDRYLAEEFVDGRELTVGVLGDRALPVIEIIPRDGFYDFRNKYPFLSPGGGATHVCPAALGASELAAVHAAALAAWSALGLEVYGRVDVLLPRDAPPSVLEINTIPGMTEASLLPEAAAADGISYPELCRLIIELSLGRRESTGGPP